MRHFEIGTRLAIGFAVVIALAAAFGAFAFNQVINLNPAGNPPGKAALQSAYLSEDLRDNVQKQYGLFQQLLITSDRAELDQLDAAIASERTRNSDLLAKFEALSLTEQQQSSLTSWKSARESYASLLNSALDLTRAGTDEARKQVFEMDTLTVRPAYLSYLGLADSLVTASRKAAEDQPRSASPVDSSRTPMLGFLVAGVLISTLLAVLITRSITNPIAEAVEVLDQIADGDVNCRAKVESNDELGQLMNRLNQQLDSQWSAAGIAERLAEGDCSVQITPTSERDVLGRSLARLRTNLKASVEAIERIAEGDLSPTRVSSPKDSLGNAMARLRETLRDSTELAKKVSEGCLDFAIVPFAATDELRSSILRIRDNLQMTAQSMDQIAEGNLTLQAEAASETDVLGKSMGRMIQSLRHTVGEALGCAATVAEVSSAIIYTAERLSEGASEHSAALAAVTEELQPNYEAAPQTERLAFAAAAGTNWKLSGEAVGQTVTAMKEVAAKSGMLDDLARKADLLTLAAALEAARAGEHGLGFAVVASELRRLGERNQEAAAEIVRMTTSGVKTAEAAADLMARAMPEMSTAPLPRIEHPHEAARESQAIAESLSASRHLAAAAAQLISPVEMLQSTLAFFKLTEEIEVPAVLQKSAAG